MPSLLSHIPKHMQVLMTYFQIILIMPITAILLCLLYWNTPLEKLTSSHSPPARYFLFSSYSATRLIFLKEKKKCKYYFDAFLFETSMVL